MLCVKYDYKTDIAVQREEAFEDGMKRKAVETVENLLRMNVLTLEQISQASGLPIETVQELKMKLAETQNAY